VVRSTSSKGEEADQSGVEAYNGKVDEVLTRYQKTQAASGIVEVLIRHVVGKLRQGELIMAVVVAGNRRVDVFPALAEAVERTKKKLPSGRKRSSLPVMRIGLPMNSVWSWNQRALRMSALRISITELLGE